jgi:hypothetical protein
MKMAGIAVMVVGLLLTIFTTVTYFTKEKVVDIGKLEISKDKPHRVSWPPFVGIAIVGIGGLMLWQGGKR